MGKCKTKAIQTDSGLIRHIQNLFRHIQAYSEPCVSLTYLKPWYMHDSDIFRAGKPWHIDKLVCSELWYIQNVGIFKIRDIFRTLLNIYDEVFCENK